MNWRYNSAQSHRLFARRAAVILSLFISVMHVQAQTQATMNAQARAEFERADSERNKTYESLLTKLSDTEGKQKLKESQRAWLAFHLRFNLRITQGTPSAGRFEAHFKLFNELLEKLSEHKN